MNTELKITLNPRFMCHPRVFVIKVLENKPENFIYNRPESWSNILSGFFAVNSYFVPQGHKVRTWVMPQGYKSKNWVIPFGT
jgi:hypothetical protein